MLVGVVPMGGIAARWAPMNVPKELLPLGLGPEGRPRSVVDSVMDAMATARVDQIVVPVLPDKAAAVMRYLGPANRDGAPIVFVVAPGPTLVANLASCAPLLAGCRVAFGMPDTQFEPDSILASCVGRLTQRCNLALGVFRSDDPAELDVVTRSGDRVRQILPKPHNIDRKSVV